MALTELTAPTVAEATAYITAHYTEYNPLRVAWTVLSDGTVDETKNDKLTYINQAFDEIHALIFKQYTPYEIVKNAIAENALAIMDAEINAKSDMQFKTLQSLGQQKNTKYNRREQGDVVGITTTPKVTQSIPITGAKAYAIINPFLRGAYYIL